MHWGDMKIAGPAWFTSPSDLPVRTALAPVGIESYAEVRTTEDGWINIWIGGETRFAGPVPADWTPPLNVHASLNPVPGLQLDLWLYAVLKKYAQLFGKYYRPAPDGLLYLNGVIEPGLGRTATDVFASREVAQYHGLVFIDTLDGQPPRTDNMAALTVETDYAEGIFMVNGHSRLVPHGSGRTVVGWTSLSPDENRVGRTLAELQGIHVNGVIYTVGDFGFEGRPRFYGALAVGGSLQAASSDSAALEVWFDWDFGRGYFRGLPVVYPVPGLWQESY